MCVFEKIKAIVSKTGSLGSKERYMCHAVDRLIRNNVISSIEATTARKAIEIEFREYWSVESYARQVLHITCPSSHNEEAYNAYRDKMQDIRHEFLDKCIGNNKTKLSPAFIAAKQFLSIGHTEPKWRDNKNKYICNAITAARNAGLIDIVTESQATNYIAVLLNGHKSLDSWLRSQLPDVFAKPVSEMTPAEYADYCTQIQSTRHRWIDNIITTLQAQGN
jgi:hypothetical protein